MKYLKSYNEAIRDSDGLSYRDKVAILESCFPISTKDLTDICQNILDDYDSEHIHIQDSVYYTNNKKMSGESSGYMAMENFIEGWRTDNSGTHEDEDFDTIWDKYLEPTSKVGTMIYLAFHNMNLENYPRINDLEHEIVRITKKIEAEVGKGNVEFMFDWNYPEMNSLRTINKPITEYTLFISYKKKKMSYTGMIDI